jgi:hypothetical protein
MPILRADAALFERPFRGAYPPHFSGAVYIALQILVAGLSVDSELFAEFADCESARLGQDDKSLFLVDWFRFFPWHIRHSEVLPMSPDHTYGFDPGSFFDF